MNARALLPLDKAIKLHEESLILCRRAALLCKLSAQTMEETKSLITETRARVEGFKQECPASSACTSASEELNALN